MSSTELVRGCYVKQTRNRPFMYNSFVLLLINLILVSTIASSAMAQSGSVVAWGANSEVQTNVPMGLSGVLALQQA